ncbi:hypothetical protein EYZ11_008345 [Aspergillus tanneri]|uniref:Uncharacterized protein n=1 Tax=Aspergillus tanneri TaxID=1220188 RepID=A0A4S3JAR8_9EURO|nr:hypothetical protein EYZ11_008345 [Aspergillus tanneri]
MTPATRTDLGQPDYVSSHEGQVYANPISNTVHRLRLGEAYPGTWKS